jgi:hypothetical protein
VVGGDIPAQVDLIKIDVEGAEMDVIIGARHLIETCHPDLVIEVHGAALRTFGHRPDELFELLTDLEYAIAPIDRTEIELSSTENLTVSCTYQPLVEPCES